MFKGKLRKILSGALAAAMCIGLLAGCSDPGASAPAASSGSSDAAASESGSEGGAGLADLDTSQEVELVMYVVSDRPAGQDVVD
jgi:putative aldouronate transport system substrate-binding protein